MDEKEGQAWWSIDWDNRDWLAMPCEMRRLRPIAEQPANHKSRKPARLIYLYNLGMSKDDILADLKIDERTVAKYFQRWIDDGVSGVCGRPCEPSLAEYMADIDAREALAAQDRQAALAEGGGTE